MSAPPRRPADAAQVAKLALLGVGTLATGAFGVVGLLAGYKYKKAHAANPAEVSVASYLDDLTHLVPPWQEAAASGSSSASPSASGPTPKEAEAQRVAALQRLEAMDEEEARALTFTFKQEAFAQVHTDSPTFPLTPALLCRVSAFLPFESVCSLACVSRGLRDFSRTLLSDRGFVFQLARSPSGFSEEYRGAIWMRISGAGALANSMSQRASSTAVDTFYTYLLKQSLGYRQLIIEQNGLSNREALPQSAQAESALAAASLDLDDLSEEARTGLDTILKDVPRTLVPANGASKSLISNPGAEASLTDADEPTSPQSPAGRARDDLLASLSNVLSVACLHDMSLGYTQGQNFVAAFLLSHLPEEDAYWLFYKVMQDPKWGLRRYYTNGLRGLLVAKEQMQRLFELYLPRLAAHFKEQEVHSDIFTEWLMTFFTFSSFPRRYPLLERVWDLMLSGGGLKFVFRTALSILFVAEPTLLEYDFEGIVFYLKQWPDDGILNPDVLLPLMCDKFRVSNAALRELEEEFEAKITREEREREEGMRARQQAREQAAAAKAAAAAQAAGAGNGAASSGSRSPQPPKSPKP